jgi:signal transduction histidine kinase
MSVSSIPPLITALCFLGFSAYVLIKLRGSAKAFSYVLWCLTTVYWQLAWAVLLSTKDPRLAYVLARVGYTGIIFIPIAFYHFTLRFLDINTEERRLRYYYLIGLLFVVLLWADHHFVRGVYHYAWGFYAKAGYQHAIYICFLSYLIYRFVPLIYREKIRSDISETRRKQITYVFWAILFYILAGSDFFDNYGAGIYPIGFLFTLICLALVSYAMVKHQLMDIRIIFRKTLIYSVASSALIAVYVGIIGFLTKGLEGYWKSASTISSAIAAAVIALLFHPFQAALQRWVDRHFPREALDQAMLREATSDFVHEIKRPLANISMPAQLALMDLEQIKDHPVAPKLRERMQYILQQSMEAGETIEAIRALSARVSLERKPVALAALLEKVLNKEENRIAEGRITVVREFDDTAPTVTGDAKQLEIALANIVKNAIDAMATNSVSKPRRLRVAARSTQDRVEIDIEDSGPGIGKSDLGRLFDPWFSTKGSGGMGIGLYLTREALRLHNADIDVQSREGEGSRFRITFPTAGVN